MKQSRIIQIVGFANSGKTRLILDLIKLLKQKQLSVVAIKSAQTHKYLSTLKDSDRFLHDGATMSAISFSDSTQFTIPKKIPLPDLLQMVQTLIEPDIILIEGFKTENYDKILVWSENLETNLDLFNTANLKLIYCQIDKYKQNLNHIKNLAITLSTTIITDVKDIDLFITDKTTED